MPLHGIGMSLVIIIKVFACSHIKYTHVSRFTHLTVCMLRGSVVIWSFSAWQTGIDALGHSTSQYGQATVL